MPEKKASQRLPQATRPGDFRIEGRLQLEGLDELSKDMPLVAHVFDRAGQLVGTGEVDPKGSFSVKAALTQPTGVQLIAGPAAEPQTLRRSAAFSRSYSAEDWSGEANRFRIKADLVVPRYVWEPWLPKWICVSGHVRKVHTGPAGTEVCPVPFVKVEIFDVDRQGCFWPFIVRWWDVLLDRPVFRIPELLKDRPFPPRPLPDPPPLERAADIGRTPRSPGEIVGFNPQPEPPKVAREIATAALRPQPISALPAVAAAPEQLAMSRAGETASLDPKVATRLDTLTLTSKIAPWGIFPWCFYSRRLVCETFTDNCGYFRCCFRWYPFHFRNGRLRFDLRPDIIVRVTQVVDGVETVLYMDPYTSTRWNVTNAHIDLFLDNEDIQCGSCDPQTRPEGTAVFFTRVGNDEVYRINQATGLYANPPFTSVAYGNHPAQPLRIHAQFGDALSAGAPQRYFRLSYRKGGGSFTPIASSLSDTRVSKVTLFSESHTLGPQTVNGVPGLYEIRDFSNFYWYNPDLIGLWDSRAVEDDTGLYTLRLEVFDQNGVKLTSAQVDYRDGTVPPPAVLPPSGDQCNLVITIDNKPPVVDLQIPAVLNECGVIPWSPALVLNFDISVSQENNRLRAWGLQYTKGVNPAVTVLASASSNNGLPGSVVQTVSGAPLLAGLTSTCAFALKLYAYAHIRNGYSFIYYREQIKAIAIERCS